MGARNKSTGRAKLLLRTSVDFISLTLAFCACLFLHAYRLNFVFHYTSSFTLSDALPLCLLHFYTSCKTLFFTAALHPRGSCTGGVMYSTLLFIFVVRLLFPLGFGSGVSLERARVCVCCCTSQIFLVLLRSCVSCLGARWIKGVLVLHGFSRAGPSDSPYFILRGKVRA